MQKPIRVLHVITGMGSGGAESMIMNLYRHIDRNEVQFDFLLRSNENIYAEEMEAMGSRVYQTASFPRHFIENAKQVDGFFAEHRYDIVHHHAGALMYMTAMEKAKKHGVPCRILHSHSTSSKYGFARPYHLLQKRRIGQLITDNFACSEDAGKWMFSSDYTIIRNAIDLDRFRFSQEDRALCRKELAIKESQLVIGHVGRFLPVKNHTFILRVFREIVRKRPDAVLLLIGEGPLLQETQKLAQELDILENVRFLGVRKDINRLLNTMDAFLFPSLYEGLPIAAVEAQANGLPVLCSDTIPKEAIITSNTKQMSLEAGVLQWANSILNTDLTRVNATAELKKAGYDIRSEALKLQNLYLRLASERTRKC